MKKIFTLFSALAVGALAFNANAATMKPGEILMGPQPGDSYAGYIQLYYGETIEFVNEDADHSINIYQGNSSTPAFVIPNEDVIVVTVTEDGEGGIDTGLLTRAGDSYSVLNIYLEVLDDHYGTFTVQIPEGLVQNSNEEVNPAQPITFTLQAMYKTVPSLSVSSAGILSITWEGVTAVSANPEEGLNEPYIEDPNGRGYNLMWNKEITANESGNGVNVDLSNILTVGNTYDLLIPQGYFLLTVNGSQYTSAEIISEVSLSSTSGDDNNGDDEGDNGDDEGDNGDDEGDNGDDEPGDDQPGDDQPGDDEPGTPETPDTMTSEATQVNSTITADDMAVELTWAETVSIVDAETLSIPVYYDEELVGELSATYVNLVAAGASEPGIETLAETGDEGTVMYLLLGAAGVVKEYGEYTVELPEGIVANADGEVNQAQTLTVTYVAGVEGVVTPESGTEFELGEEVVVSIAFTGKVEVVESEDAPVLLTDYAEYDEQLAWEEDVVYVEGNAVVINLGTELEPGTYYLSFRAGSVTVDGAPNVAVEDYEIVVLEGETDGIHSIGAELNGNETIYNLKGVKVSKNNLNKGIYIINGKKVMVK